MYRQMRSLKTTILTWMLARHFLFGTSQAFYASSILPTRLPLLKAVSLFAEEKSSSSASSAPIEGPIECYVVKDDLAEETGEKPVVVCTSEPDEYAWFNGLDRDAMRPTDGVEEGTVECVEGASPRGIPEWECKQDE